ncbi:MAG: hypothetical protein AAF597_02765 [Bacteroidota bacterium]
MRYPFALTLLFVLFLCTCVRAQSSPTTNTDVAEADMKLKLRDGKDGVYLRWLPASADRWARYREAGYWVERRRTGGAWERLTQAPFREATRESLATDAEDLQTMIDFLYDGDEQRSYRAVGEGEDALAKISKQEEAFAMVLIVTELSYERTRQLGLGFVDTEAEVGTVYEYRIVPAAFAQEATAPRWVIRGKGSFLAPPPAPTAEFKDREVTLTWPHAPAHANYDVLRRIAGSETWETRNDGPIGIWVNSNEPITFLDSLADNETYYEYALLARDAFDFPSARSSVTWGRGVTKSQLTAPLVEARETPGAFTINWSFPPQSDTSDLAYCVVYRALDPLGGQSRISGALPPEQRSFIDSIYQDEQWYSVHAYAADGSHRESVRVHVLASDTIPPTPPTALRATADQEGFVTLNWEPSASTDVIGYRVFFSHQEDRPGTRITDTLEVVNRRLDTIDLKTLEDTIYYRVVALDERENVSDFSKALALPVPDINPPTPPRLRSFTADTNGVTLTWAPSSSTDVVSYLFQRRGVGTNYWETFYQAPPTTEVSRLLDNTGRTDIRYEYQLVAVDDAGLRGTSNGLTARRLAPVVRPAVADLSGIAQRELDRIELTWNYPPDPTIRQFKIYRAAPGGELLTYRTLDAEAVDRRLARRTGQPAQWRFRDEAPRRDTEYVYAVQAIYRNGGLSRLGDSVTVKF